MHKGGGKLLNGRSFKFMFLIEMQDFSKFITTGDVDARKAAHDKVFDSARLIEDKAKVESAGS
ncbi:uncharacterized protein N7477_007505 [Penicillium maclennaniae]|uniref:uncharacterized protein n=1 Tax=Penicillium maclennaniae TaxID=1343394 RepID=UPI002541690B|nr:uncharacterized protein N7477_007505 [Penicillium maclennaniae]KAJ5665057.1 hypothetical protein N7477_007505 [Penicillium maclennaniae]